jgi:hypothetical protein
MPRASSRIHDKPRSTSVRSSVFSSATALLVINHEPLHRTAWAAFHSARQRLAKASADLHRHEQIDLPAYQAWVHQTFPVYLSMLRELHDEVLKKGRQVEMVQAMAAMTSRSLKKLWKEQQDFEANPEAFEARFRSADDDQDRRESKHPKTDDDDDDDFFRGSGPDNRDFSDRDFAQPNRASGSKHASRAAKELYRRLVQRLHPDRGGEWTPARKRLWHEVQQAWACQDLDWLSRLEVEWESANEVLSPRSALSRLRRAMEELVAARRDVERKLRDYRRSVEWRFTLSEKKRANLQRRTEAAFQHDVSFLQRQLAYLNATISAWESPRPAHRRRHASSYRQEL